MKRGRVVDGDRSPTNQPPDSENVSGQAGGRAGGQAGTLEEAQLTDLWALTVNE